MTDTTPAPIGADALRKELIADIREVFDASGQETPQIVRDVIEYANSWLQVYIQKKAESPTQPAAPASHGAEDALVAALERVYFWMDAQADTQSKGGHATFDLMMLREERDAAKAAIDAARAKQEGK